MPTESLPGSPLLVLRYATGIEIDPFNLPARACPILGEQLAALQERELARW